MMTDERLRIELIRLAQEANYQASAEEILARVKAYEAYVRPISYQDWGADGSNKYPPDYDTAMCKGLAEARKI